MLYPLLNLGERSPNELAGNLSLHQEIRFIELINRWIAKDVMKRPLMEKLNPVDIRWIKMSKEILENVDYSSKLERDEAFIKKLMAEGKPRPMRS